MRFGRATYSLASSLKNRVSNLTSDVWWSSSESIKHSRLRLVTNRLVGTLMATTAISDRTEGETHITRAKNIQKVFCIARPKINMTRSGKLLETYTRIRSF